MWNSAALEEGDVLLAPRETTSRWTASDREDRNFRLTVKDVKSPELLQIPDPASSGRLVPDPDSKVLHITLIKSNASYRVAIDGVAPSPTDIRAVESNQPERELQMIGIHTHRGMHYDYASNTSVFSPCAVSVFLEDGERAPEAITVSVVQQFTTSPAPEGFGRTEVMGQTQLAATAASDVTLNAVLVPYPAPFPRLPSVAILDQSPVYRAKFRDLQGLFWSTIPSLAYISYSLYNRPYTSPQLSASPSGVLASMGSFLYSAVGIVNPATQINAERGRLVELINSSGIGAALAISAGTMLVLNLPIFAGGATAAASTYLGTQAAGLTTAKLLETINQKTVMSALKGLWSAVKKPPAPKPTKIKLTIPDLIGVLNTLGGLVELDEKEVQKINETNSMRKERAVWVWLMEAESFSLKKQGLGGVMNHYGRLGVVKGSNPLDTDGFVCGTGASISSSIRVTIDDSEVCGVHSGSLSYGFECGRGETERGQLGAISSGLLQQLIALEDAICNFRAQLIKHKNRDLWNNKGLAMIQMGFGVVFRALEATARNLNLLPDNQRLRQGREALSIAARASIKSVLSNLDVKLSSYFTVPGSPGQRMKATLAMLLYNRIPPAVRDPSTSPIVPIAVDYLRRELPHVSLASNLLFPSALVRDMEHVDVDIASAVVREATPLGDAAKALTASMTSARTALRQCLSLWQLSNLRPRLVLAYSNADAPLTNRSLPLRPPDSYALVFQLPADIRSESVMRPRSEPLQLALELVADHRRNSKSTRDVYEALKLPSTEFHAAALQLIAELCVDETMDVILRQAAAPDRLLLATSNAMKHPLKRAAGRAEKVAGILREAMANSTTGSFTDDDPGMQCTRSGLDASRFASRMRLSTLRGATAKAYMNSLASAIATTARAVSGDPMRFVSAPSEPLASLYSVSLYREEAARQKALELLALVGEGQATGALDAIEASYPALLVVPRGQLTPEQVDRFQPPRGANVETEVSPPAQPLSDELLVAAMQERMAKLCVSLSETGLPPLGGSPSKQEALQYVVDKLTAPTAPADLLFHVPFGYGDPSPPLRLFPVGATMFASIPVWLQFVVEGLHAVKKSLLSGATSDADMLVKPRFAPCVTATIDSAFDETAGMTDEIRSLINMAPVGPAAAAPSTPSMTDKFAFREPPETIRARLLVDPESLVLPSSEVAFLASASPEQASVADATSSMIWNAERLLQVQCWAASRRVVLFSLDLPVADGYQYKLISDTTGTRFFASAADRYVATQLEETLVEFGHLHYRMLRARFLEIIDKLPEYLVEEDEAIRQARVDAAQFSAPIPQGTRNDALSKITLPPADGYETPDGSKPLASGAPTGAVLLDATLDDLTPEQLAQADKLYDAVKGSATLDEFAMSQGWGAGEGPVVPVVRWMENVMEIEILIYEEMIRRDWTGNIPNADNLVDISDAEKAKIFYKRGLGEMPARTEEDLKIVAGIKDPPGSNEAERLSRREDAQTRVRRYLSDPADGSDADRDAVSLGRVSKLRIVGKDSFFKYETLFSRMLDIRIRLERLLDAYRIRKSYATPRMPHWSVEGRRTFLLSMALSIAMSKPVLHNTGPELHRFVNPLPDREKNEMIEVLDRCINGVKNGIAPPGSQRNVASMRLGEVAAALFEFSKRGV